MTLYNGSCINRREKQQEEEAEETMGVSTTLEPYKDPWTITKMLENNDVGHCSRLLLRKNLVENHILPFWTEEQCRQLMTRSGIQVKIKDLDTWSDHELTFKMWLSSRSYVFDDNWSEQFVRRRNLHQGDEIRIYWDRYHFSFCFSVLRRASPK